MFKNIFESPWKPLAILAFVIIVVSGYLLFDGDSTDIPFGIYENSIIISKNMENKVVKSDKEWRALQPMGLRYCVNSASLQFTEKNENE